MPDCFSVAICRRPTPSFPLAKLEDATFTSHQPRGRKKRFGDGMGQNTLTFTSRRSDTKYINEEGNEMSKKITLVG